MAGPNEVKLLWNSATKCEHLERKQVVYRISLLISSNVNVLDILKNKIWIYQFMFWFFTNANLSNIYTEHKLYVIISQWLELLPPIAEPNHQPHILGKD